MKNVWIGIDISLNSTGVVVGTENQTWWFSFPSGFSEKQIHESDVYAFKDLLDFEGFNVFSLNRKWKALSKTEKKDNSLSEKTKLADAITNSNIIKQTIDAHLAVEITSFPEDIDIHVAIEGFSMGSKGRSFIDLVGYGYLMREKWINEKQFEIYTPSAVKKWAGKRLKVKTGGANKTKMLEMFCDEEHNFDPVAQFIQSNKTLFLKGKDVKKPLDDLIDAWWIMQKIKNDK